MGLFPMVNPGKAGAIVHTLPHTFRLENMGGVWSEEMSVEITTGPVRANPSQEPDDVAVAAEEAVTAAKAVLHRRFGAKIDLIEPEDLRGSGGTIVLRVRVSTSPFSLPRTLV